MTNFSLRTAEIMDVSLSAFYSVPSIQDKNVLNVDNVIDLKEESKDQQKYIHITGVLKTVSAAKASALSFYCLSEHFIDCISNLLRFMSLLLQLYKE